MTDFIDIQRRFVDLTDAELEDTERLLSFSEHDLGPAVDWSELLKHRRIILLAEAGAGKTREMEEQAKRLVEEGRFAFFLPLESLDREPVVDLLSADDAGRFEDWKKDFEASAWFFLDAVDELKLTHGKLDRSLRHLSRSIDGHLGRTRVIISCRPSDWRPSLDLITVRNRLPVPVRSCRNSSRAGEEVFVEALRRDIRKPNPATQEEQDDAGQDSVRTVAMLPMSDAQIKLFAQQLGVDDAAAFLAEIAKQDAWKFARRPLDLTELIATWTSSGRLGTRAEQYEANVTSKLRDDPDRTDHGILTDVRARHGAERLALALTLTRTRTVRSPEQALHIQRAAGVLDAASILCDWTDAQRQTLLRRAVFEPATYGRVRFHHRSVQEYLAARHLQTLRQRGMSINALFRLLFAERYGVKVVRPSMRAVAAWLALWEDAVRSELVNREPEVLLVLGDPETLDLPARSDLVRAFVAAYGHGRWRGLNVPNDEVRRLAHSELAPVIRECWGNGPANDDVRDLLVTMIWQGPVESCADLALAAAFDTTWRPYDRIIAIRALLACGQKDSTRQLADHMIANRASWPDRVVHGVAADLFPRIITAKELIELMERTPEPIQTIGGFGWASKQIVDAIEPWSDSAIALRDGMANLIWRGSKPAQERFHICGKYDHLVPALATLCERQLSETLDGTDDDLIRACVIAFRFSNGEAGRRETGTLKAHFDVNTAMRRAAFWADLAIMDAAAPAKDDWQRFCCTAFDGLLGNLTQADRTWLEPVLADESRPDRRAVALYALIKFWHEGGRIVSELDAIRMRLKENAVLDRILTERTAPPEKGENRVTTESIERKQQRRQRIVDLREELRLENWTKWRDELLIDPVDAFSEEKRTRTLSNVHSWLAANSQERNRYNIWEKGALEQAFGPDIAGRAADAFRALWRTTRPRLWFAQPAKERNSTPDSWIFGLLGISVEAERPGWAAALSPDDARIAAAYAAIELNGFAPFIADLVEWHPAAVEKVIGAELSAELSVGGDHDYLPTLQYLAHAEGSLRQIFVRRLLVELRSWASTCVNDTGPRWARHLDQVLTILDASEDVADRRVIAKECADRYEAEPSGVLAMAWLKGAIRFDAVQGTQALVAALPDVKDLGVRCRAIETFSTLFGPDGVVVEIEDLGQRANALGQLVRCAYAFIRPEDDLIHEGVYSPNNRDNAERARSFLLASLVDTAGPEARRVVLELSDEPNFTRMSDRLRLLARERTAADAEFEVPFDVEAVTVLETRFEGPPRDREDLFAVLMDRLNDLAHDLAHHDFTDRRTVGSITEEAEMQRTLAWRLDNGANGAYRVTREDEVADRNSTDIRLSAVVGDQKAVVEVKIADSRWTLADLRRALRNQLVGKYLRHANCKVGCLLLSYHGEKSYWKHPDTGRHLRFAEMVGFLNDEARAIENETMHDVHVAVFGLDLTDPPVAPARCGN